MSHDSSEDPVDPPNTTGKRLVIALHGKSKEDIARRIGVSVGTVYTWIRDERDPGASKIAAIARECGVSADWLLCLVDHPTPIPGKRAMILDESLEAAVLEADALDYDTVREFIDMTPDLFHGLGYLPDRFRVVTTQIGDALTGKIWGRIRDELPELYRLWRDRHGLAVDVDGGNAT